MLEQFSYTFISPCDGVSFAFGANGNWSADLNITFPTEGPTIAPEHVVRGDGLTVDRVNGTGLPAGRLIKDLTFGAGWTHVQYMWGESPLLARARFQWDQTRLSGGETCRIPELPVVPGHFGAKEKGDPITVADQKFAVSAWLWDGESAFGTFADPGGTTHVDHTYVGSTSVSGVVVHVPVTPSQLPPPLLPISYCAFG